MLFRAPTVIYCAEIRGHTYGLMVPDDFTICAKILIVNIEHIIFDHFVQFTLKITEIIFFIQQKMTSVKTQQRITKTISCIFQDIGMHQSVEVVNYRKNS